MSLPLLLPFLPLPLQLNHFRCSLAPSARKGNPLSPTFRRSLSANPSSLQTKMTIDRSSFFFSFSSLFGESPQRVSHCNVVSLSARVLCRVSMTRILQHFSPAPSVPHLPTGGSSHRSVFSSTSRGLLIVPMVLLPFQQARPAFLEFSLRCRRRLPPGFPFCGGGSRSSVPNDNGSPAGQCNSAAFIY